MGKEIISYDDHYRFDVESMKPIVIGKHAKKKYIRAWYKGRVVDSLQIRKMFLAMLIISTKIIFYVVFDSTLDWK